MWLASGALLPVELPVIYEEDNYSIDSPNIFYFVDEEFTKSKPHNLKEATRATLTSTVELLLTTMYNTTMSLETSSGNSTLFDNVGEEHGPDIIVVVLLLIVFIIGIIGNFLAILVIVVLAEYKKVLTHWYVLQLAIADTIFLLTIPFRVAHNLNTDWRFPNWICKATETMFYLNYYSSVSFLVIMSIDRYIAICHRFSVRLNKLRTKCATHLITSTVWILSILICIPVMLYTNPTGTLPNCRCEFMAVDANIEEEMCARRFIQQPIEFKECVEEQNLLFHKACLTTQEELKHNHSAMNFTTPNPACHYRDRPPSFRAFIFLNFIVFFIIPVIIMSVCYSLIAVRMRTSRIKSTYSSTRSKESIPNPVCRQKRSKSIVSVRDSKNRNRVTTMCVSLVLLFLFCWFPFHAVHMARMNGINGGTEQYCQNLFDVALLIAYFSVSSHSALNPCLYNFIGARTKNRLSSAASSVRKSVRQRSTRSRSSFSASCTYHNSNRTRIYQHM
ncbi:somatostatin receptor type 2-like isoform X2 [Styela clava]